MRFTIFVSYKYNYYICHTILTLTHNKNMKRVLIIALALISCLAAEAQLRTIKPSHVFKVPNISNATYESGNYDDTGNPLFYDLHYNGTYWMRSGGDVGSIVASSTLSPQGSANYRAKNIYDLNHETAWVEGVKGNGVGQWIEYRDVSGCSISSIKILNGYVKSDKAWNENARVKRLKVYCNGKPKCILELQNSRSLQLFEIDGGLGYDVHTIRFEILDVYPGSKYQDTAISEIYFDCTQFDCDGE